MAETDLGTLVRILFLFLIISASCGVFSTNMTSKAKYNEASVKRFKNGSLENNSVHLKENDMIETSCHVMTEKLTAIAKVSVSSALENLCNYSSIETSMADMEYRLKSDIEILKKILSNIINKITNIEEKMSRL